jgi:hypothetical protein
VRWQKHVTFNPTFCQRSYKDRVKFQGPQETYNFFTPWATGNLSRINSLELESQIVSTPLLTNFGGSEVKFRLYLMRFSVNFFRFSKENPALVQSNCSRLLSSTSSHIAFRYVSYHYTADIHSTSIDLAVKWIRKHTKGSYLVISRIFQFVTNFPVLKDEAFQYCIPTEPYWNIDSSWHDSDCITCTSRSTNFIPIGRILLRELVYCTHLKMVRGGRNMLWGNNQ